MRIYAVIVTFNPNENVMNLINALRNQNVKSIVVDNGSKDFDFKDVAQNPDCYLLQLDNNYGIASAQNQGIKKAIGLGANSILFFDQDSMIPENFVADLQDDYILLSNKNILIGALGPRFIDERKNFYYKTIGISKHGLRTKHDVSNIKEPFNSVLLISSGSLISVDTLEKVGLMREEYFIDYVDTEWCIRAEAKGYKNYMSSKAVMYHTIGDNIKENNFFTMPVHSPFRRYYIIRNTFYMFKEPHISNLFVLHQLIINVIHQLLITYSAKDQRVQYIKSFMNGLKDGFRKMF